MARLGDALRAVRCVEIIEDDPVTGELRRRSETVRELARQSGVSHTQISRIESGTIATPAAGQLIDLARALGRKPAPLLILAGHISGEEARSELADVFYDGAELADLWGDWATFGWDEACRIARDPDATPEQMEQLAYDVFTAGEAAETLWADDADAIVPLGPGQADLRQLVNAWRFLYPERRRQLLTYARTQRRMQELEELAEVEQWRLQGAQISTTAAPPAAFDEQHLTDLGFEGFVPALGLPQGAPGVPGGPGVYVVLRRSQEPPEFLRQSVGGHFKGEDPTVSIASLEDKWVSAAQTLYIGRASNLRGRLTLLARYGSGAPVAHRGGRFLWQLSDHRDLLVAWRETTDQVDAEAELVAAFEDHYQTLPYANLNRPGGAS